MAQPTPEEQEALRKKLESMSPEELKEFQKQQCIFCHIVSGKVQAKKIYEDDKTIAVLDINPANPGHVLLMPKEHYMIMPQLPDPELGHIFKVAKKISNILLKTLDVRGTNIIVANGPAAGQRAQHFMVHIIPRKEGDGIEFTLPREDQSEEMLNEVAEKVRSRLKELLNYQPKQKTAQDIIKEAKPKVVEAEFDEKEEEIEEELQEDVAEEEPDVDEEEIEEQSEEDHDEDEDFSEEESDEDDSEEGEDDEESDDGNIDLDAIARVLHG